MQQLCCYFSQNRGKIEETGSDEKLRGELGTRMGSVGTIPLTNRTERNRTQQGRPAAVPPPTSGEPNDKTD